MKWITSAVLVALAGAICVLALLLPERHGRPVQAPSVAQPAVSQQPKAPSHPASSGTLAADRRPSVVSSAVCFAQDAKWKLVSRANPGEAHLPSIGWADIEALYQNGERFQRQGDLDQALLAYTTAALKANLSGLQYLPTRRRIVDLNIINHDGGYPIMALDSFNYYQNRGRQLLCDKLAARIEMVRDSMPVTSRSTCAAYCASTVEHIHSVRDIVTMERILTTNGNDIAVLGQKQLECWATGLLGFGVAMTEGRWREITENDIPKQPWILVSTGVLGGQAYQLTSTEVFIPGAQQLGKMSGVSLAPCSLSSMCRTRVWEYCIMDREWDDVRSKAYATFQAGQIAFAAGKRDEAVRLCLGSMGGHLMFTEPLLDLNTRHLLGDADLQSIVEVLAPLVDAIESVRKELISRRGSLGLKEEVLRLQMDGALFHAYTIRDVMRGRLFASQGSRSRSAREDAGAGIEVIGHAFVDRWCQGMHAWGVIIEPTHWAVEPILTESEWRAHQGRKCEGVYAGCYETSGGQLVVAGIRALSK